ncbi:solute carrier family 35 member C2-like isoform X3 [Homarus americanus]|uniref:solute carrier family 35 member C2-like isoform X3 n=1 Tax=Homarus americanus TaxID=6706 RepID=UPI001C48CFB4|nr:solute carrier family 35 member C2-like isoform X3 [Homarus americanus]
MFLRKIVMSVVPGSTSTRKYPRSPAYRLGLQHFVYTPGIVNMTGLEVTEGRLTRRRGGRRLGQMIIHCIRTLILILMYYTCSIGLTFYQKRLFRDFKFPLTVVIVHLFIKFVLAGLFRVTYTLVTGIPRVTLPWDIYWRRVLPPGAAAGIDIGLSQWSLEFITVALYTMSKSTALLFILIFAIIFKLEEMRCSVVVLVVLITGGLFLFTYKYTQFNLFGFILVIIASLLSGLRWTLSQLVMQKSELGLSNPIDMVYHIQPWMTVSLLPLAIIMEGTAIAASEYGFRFTDSSDALHMWGRVMFGAVLAFFMEVSEYLVVCFTSSLTFSIAGVAKEVMTLSLAVYIYNEHLTSINLMGFLLCIIGIALHVVLKAIYPPKPPPPQQQHISLSPADGYQKVPLLSDTDGEEQELYSRALEQYMLRLTCTATYKSPVASPEPQSLRFRLVNLKHSWTE